MSFSSRCDNDYPRKLYLREGTITPEVYFNEITIDTDFIHRTKFDEESFNISSEAMDKHLLYEQSRYETKHIPERFGEKDFMSKYPERLIFPDEKPTEWNAVFVLLPCEYTLIHFPF
jgi:hypothetical protein